MKIPGFDWKLLARIKDIFFAFVFLPIPSLNGIGRNTKGIVNKHILSEQEDGCAGMR